MIPFNPFSALTSKIYGGIAIAALALAFVQTVRIEGFLFIHGYKQDLREADAKIAGMQVASDDNRKAAEEQVRQQQAAFDQAAKESQDEYETQLAAYRGRAGTYAASHRLPRLQADCSTATASSKGEDPGLPSDDASRSDYIAVRQDDYDALIENTVRLQAAHDWAKALIVSGVAEPAIPAPDLSSRSDQ